MASEQLSRTAENILRTATRLYGGGLLGALALPICSKFNPQLGTPTLRDVVVVWPMTVTLCLLLPYTAAESLIARPRHRMLALQLVLDSSVSILWALSIAAVFWVLVPAVASSADARWLALFVFMGGFILATPSRITRRHR